jgi:uncharacterized protein (DUF305 family)
MEHKHHEHMTNNHEHHKIATPVSGSNPCTDRLTDIEYLEHMIPHHQVAVDMSKILIKNTKNDFMLSLAYNIIKSQQEEIIMLNNYLITLKDFKGYDYQSELLI